MLLRVCRAQPLQNVTLRCFSAQQAAVALRPFYFLVHPDRFANIPEVQRKNERSLQVFNGYLSDLFPNPKAQSPVEVRFSIMRNNKLQDIVVQLSGHDALGIVKTTLEKFELSTATLPALRSAPRPAAGHSQSAEDLWETLRQRENSRRKQKSLAELLHRKRSEALSRADLFEKTRESIQDEVQFVQQKTGAKEIIWAIDWDQSYMRRCLINVLQMLKQIDAAVRERVVMAINNHVLVFGRGSFVCCDGSIQFGADDVSEAWLAVCLESTVRRFEVRNLERLVGRVGELLGGAELLVSPKDNLLQTTHQLQSLIVRVSSRPRAEREALLSAAAGTTLEVCNSYSEMNVSADGRIQLPCNVDGRLLLQFLQRNAARSLDLKRQKRYSSAHLETCKRRCCAALELRDLDWDASIPDNDLIRCIEQLTAHNPEVLAQLKGLKVHISHDPNVHIRPSGAISVPLASFR